MLRRGLRTLLHARNASVALTRTSCDATSNFHFDPAVMKMRGTQELASRAGASPEVQESIDMVLDLVQKREDFTSYATSGESRTCAEIAEATQSHDWKAAHEDGKTTWKLTVSMRTGAIEGQFLKSLVSIQRAKKILDVGMFTGYSALCMAEALPADGEVTTLDTDEYLKEMVNALCKTSPHYNKLNIVTGDAIDIMKALANKEERFDIIFLDATKAQYRDYFKVCFEDGLLQERGTVVVDNAFFCGTGYTTDDEDNPSRVKEFADMLVGRPDIHKVLVPLRDGIYLLRRLKDVEGEAA